VRPEGFDPEGGQRSLVHPVEDLAWEQARDVMEHMGLALPSEAQWEHGARSGTDTPWWTGTTVSSLDGAANVRDEAYIKTVRSTKWETGGEGPPDGWAFSAPVGTYRANDFGLHDVIGNAFEWCQDANDPNFYAAWVDVPDPKLSAAWPEQNFNTLGNPAVDPMNDAAWSTHAFRGGGFGLDPEAARSAARFAGPHGGRAVGVRAARPVR